MIEITDEMVEAHFFADPPDNEILAATRYRIAAVAPLIEAQARERALREAAECVRRIADIEASTCAYGSTEWDTGAFNCRLAPRGDCLCVDRIEKSEAAANAVLALIGAPQPKGDGE